MLTTKNLFIFISVTALGFGLTLLLAPEFILNMYATQKVDMTGALDNVTLSYGMVLTAAGIAYFIIRDAGASIARRGFLFYAAISNALGIIVHIRAILKGTENSLGWSIVLLAVLIILWSGMLLSKEKASGLV